MTTAIAEMNGTKPQSGPSTKCCKSCYAGTPDETPLPVCKGCGFPFEHGDAGFLRRRQCWTCDFAQAYRLIRRVVRQQGGRRTLTVLYGDWRPSALELACCVPTIQNALLSYRPSVSPRPKGFFMRGPLPCPGLIKQSESADQAQGR